MSNQIFYTGVCESRDDPLKIGRIRVRVHAIHTYDKSLLPTDDLPWATVVSPTTSAGVSGIGMTTAIMQGSTVLLFFLDGENYQIPVVIGTIPGISTESANNQLGFYDKDAVYPLEKYKGESDIPRLARGDDEKYPEEYDLIGKERTTKVYSGLKDTWDEPEYSSTPNYPQNQVWMSEGGNFMELDSTPGNERIHIVHRQGSRKEYQADGGAFEKIVKDNFQIIYGEDKIYIKGNARVTVDGNCQILVKTSAELVVDGNLNMKVKGNFNESIDGSYVKHVKGNAYIVSEGELVLRGSQIHLNSPGKAEPNDLCPQLDMTVADDALQPDEKETPTGISDQDYQDLKERSGVDIQGIEDVVDNTPSPETSENEKVVSDCTTIPDDWDYNLRLTSRWNLGALTTKAVYPHKIVTQHGLTEKQIICNLKNLAENILDPIANKVGMSKIQINSGFRQGSGKSKHERGRAVDIHFIGYDFEDYSNLIKWIKENLPFRQVILERGKNYWLHVDYTETDLKKEVLTRTSPDVYKSGIIKVS